MARLKGTFKFMSRQCCNLLLLMAILIALPLASGASAQGSAEPGAQEAASTHSRGFESGIPGFWDPRARLEGLDAPAGRTLRILTSDDFPPLHFGGPDAVPTGFSVELARLACEALRVACTIQARSFGTLLEALADGEGDVVAAAIRLNDVRRADFSTTQPYFRFPARFATRANGETQIELPDDLRGATVAVVAETAHEAYLRNHFPQPEIITVPNLSIAQRMVMRGEVDYVFGDGLALALWIGGQASQECCVFAGEPYLDAEYFGEGIGFVMRSEDRRISRAFDEALHRVWTEGDFARTWLAFFPVSPFEPPGTLITQAP
jgi:polar amino acid transport system substrate-binding protein